MTSSRKVIIIGAGAAGIAAASRLYENGIHDVLVLEAEDRIGGRIFTLDVDDRNFIEIGAQWVHGEKGNAVFELAQSRDMFDFNDLDLRSMFFAQSCRTIPDKNLVAEVVTTLDKIRENVDEDVKEFVTSGAYFLHKIDEALSHRVDLSHELKEQFTEWFHQFINSVDGSDTWFESAASTLTEYRECDGNHNVSWKANGYRSILSILMEKAQELSNGKFLMENIIMNKEVLKIANEGDKVLVKCADGKIYEADHVIVTVSLGVLKDQFTTMFENNVLPQKKILAIEHLEIGSVNKMYLKFPHQWWSDEMNGIGLLWCKENKNEYMKKGLGWLTDVFSFFKVDNNPLMLCGWVVGESSRIMEKMDEEDVKNQLIYLLRDFLGHLYKVPEPVWFLRSTWKADKHFSGSYSFRTPACDALNVSSVDLASPIFSKNGSPVICFAGEATHRHFYSTVHGAIETGWREANRLIALDVPKKMWRRLFRFRL